MAAPVKRAPAARPSRPAAAMAPLALLERASRGEFPPTVYLEGSDEAVKAAFLAEFRRCWAAAVPEAPQARVMRPGEHDVDQILAAFQNVSLFAPRELTLVLEVEDLGRSEKRVEALAAGLATPAGGSCLVLVESEAETVRKTLAPLRAACAVRVVADRPEPPELLRWGALRLAAQGCKADPGALEALLETCEDDAIAFMNETGKLAALAGASGVVTKQHVAALNRQCESGVGEVKDREVAEVARDLWQDDCRGVGRLEFAVSDPLDETLRRLSLAPGCTRGQRVVALQIHWPRLARIAHHP